MKIKINSIIKSLWNEFVYGGHLQCLGGIGIIYFFGFVFQVKINWHIFLVAYLVFYPIYASDRIKEIKNDEISNPERTKHIKKYIKITSKIILVLFLSLIVFLFYLKNLKLALFSLSILVMGLLYPIYFKNITKKIFFFKNLYVALFFAIAVFFPIIYYSYNLSYTILVLMFYIFLRTLLMQFYLDCKDVKIDKIVGLKTLPVLFGKQKSLFILKTINLLITPLIIIFIVFLFDFPSLIVLLFLIGILVVHLSHVLIKKDNYYGYVLVSSEFFFWLILLLIINI